MNYTSCLDCLLRSLSYRFAGCFQSCMNIACSTKMKMILRPLTTRQKILFYYCEAYQSIPRYCSFKHSTVRTTLGTFILGKSQRWIARRVILEIELPRSFWKFLLKAHLLPGISRQQTIFLIHLKFLVGWLDDWMVPWFDGHLWLQRPTAVLCSQRFA